MGKPAANRLPTIERRYQGEKKPCMQAIELLIKKAGGSNAGKDAEGRSVGIRAEPSIRPQRK